MNTGQWIVLAVVLVILVGGAVYVTSPQKMAQEVMMEEEVMMEQDEVMMDEKDGAMMEKGSYEPYAPEKLAMANTGDVVLFFRATWCPTCRALDADIRAGSIPADLTILDVNYDTATVLKQKYGVTMQHTLVQVDANGTLIKKWTGSPTLTDLVAQVN